MKIGVLLGFLAQNRNPPSIVGPAPIGAIIRGKKPYWASLVYFILGQKGVISTNQAI